MKKLNLRQLHQKKKKKMTWHEEQTAKREAYWAKEKEKKEARRTFFARGRDLSKPQVVSRKG